MTFAMAGQHRKGHRTCGAMFAWADSWAEQSARRRMGMPCCGAISRRTLSDTHPWSAAEWV